MRLFLILFSFICLDSLSAAEKQLVLVRPTLGTERVPPALGRQIEKLALQVVMGRPNVELLLMGSEAPSQTSVDILVVESEIYLEASGYRIEARLLDLKGKRLIRNVKKSGIQEIEVVRFFQAAIEAIFEDKEKKLPLNNSENQIDSSNKSSLSPVSPKRKIESPSVINLPSSKTINFRELVKGLKVGVDEKIAQANNDKKKEESKNNNLIAKKDLSQTNSQQQIPEKKKNRVAVQSFELSLKLQQRSISTEGFTSVEGKTGILIASLNAFYGIPESWNNWGIFYGGYLGRVNSSPFEVGLPYKIYSGIGVKQKTDYLALVLARESLHFFGLASFGGGNTAGLIDINSLGVSGNYCFNLWKSESCIKMDYFIVMAARTGYRVARSAAGWSGSGWLLEFISPIKVYGWNFSIITESLQLKSEPVDYQFVGVKPFLIEESRLALSFQRSF
jgi:hypothetical protein